MLQDNLLAEIAKSAKSSIGIVKRIHQKTDGGKKLDFDLALDLIANADRRFHEGSVDDAVLRLYRVVEMAAQEQLENKYQIISDNVDASKIRSRDLRQALEESRGSDDNIKVSQTMAYKILDDFGDQLGRRFIEQQARFKDIQSARNYSYLAHGTKSAQPKVYESLRSFIMTMLGNPVIHQFPIISL